jgi:hypothetical protein
LSQRLFCERLELALPPGLDDVPLGPAAGDLVLLTDAGLVGEPDFYRVSQGSAFWRATASRCIESGPIPAVHGVVRWRLIDLVQWIFEEFRITVAKQTLSRELPAGSCAPWATVNSRPDRPPTLRKKRHHAGHDREHGVPAHT